MKSQSFIQMSIDRKQVLGISLNELEKRKENFSQRKRETIKICGVDGKGSFHNGSM